MTNRFVEKYKGLKIANTILKKIKVGRQSAYFMTQDKSILIEIVYTGIRTDIC